MKLGVINISEVRKMVSKNRATVTDRDIEDVMENINNEIIRKAGLGETSFTAYANVELGKIGSRDFRRDNRETTFRPIIDALREAGYTVEVDVGYFSGGVAEITIHW